MSTRRAKHRATVVRYFVMKANFLQAAMAATLALAWAAATHAQSTPASDTQTVVKEAARTVGHAVAHSARTVGHEVRDRTRTARETTRDDSKKAGHAVAHSAKTVGKKVKDGAEKVKTTVTRKSTNRHRKIKRFDRAADACVTGPASGLCLTGRIPGGTVGRRAGCRHVQRRPGLGGRGGRDSGRTGQHCGAPGQRACLRGLALRHAGHLRPAPWSALPRHRRHAVWLHRADRSAGRSGHGGARLAAQPPAPSRHAGLWG